MAMPVGATLDHCGIPARVGGGKMATVSLQVPILQGEKLRGRIHTPLGLCQGVGVDIGRLKGKVPSERLPG